MSHAKSSGRWVLLTGLSAAFIAVSFAYLHRLVLRDWPTAGLDGPGTMLAYFATGTAFQFAVPVLCLAAFIVGAALRRLRTTRVGLVGAGAALLGYALYVRSRLSMIRWSQR